MRIGIDARYIQDHFPGIGRYAYNLIRALSAAAPGETFVVFFNPKLANSRFAVERLASPNVHLVLTDVPTFSLLEQTKLPAVIEKERLDVFHAPYYITPYHHKVPTVVTIHDVNSSLYPEYLPSVQARIVFETTTRLAIRTSQLIIVDSRAAKGDLMRQYGVPTEKIRVVHLGADEFEADSAPSTLPEPLQGVRYVLYLGINKPHKNLTRLVRAWAKVTAPQKLVLAGKEDARYPETRREVEALDLIDRVIFLGNVREEQMPALYSGADLFVFPSLSEGFGLPVLEAMKSGVPVIASQASSMPEIVGDAGILVDPYDENEIAMAIQLALTNDSLRAELRNKAFEQAGKFSWQRTAEETLTVYREVANYGRKNPSGLQRLLSRGGRLREPR